MMKNLKQFSAVSIIGLVMLFFATSCDDDSETFFVTAPTAPVLADLGFTQLELDPLNTSNPAVTLSWSESDYGQPTAVNYSVQFSTDDAFTSPVNAATITGQTSITLSIGEINSAAGSAGLNPFEWAALYTRVVASIGTQQSESIASNTLNFQVFPFFNYPFEDYYLVGNGTAADWNNNNNNPALFRDPNNGNHFTFTGFFTKGGGGEGDGRFKVLETRGLWQPQWGSSHPDGDDPIESVGDIAGNPGTQDSDPGRFGVLADGYYEFTIDFGTKKYSVSPFDASGAADFTSMIMQGSALTDTAMNQLAFDTHLWYISSIRLVPGDVQFMTNTGSVWGAGTSFSGQATENGGSIPVIVEDDYEVWFNDLTGRYIMIPLNL
ncbi:SusE domain-containing protein [Seonamhaeicola sp.]|uniref:SusE domain-containing protein n=1 Tax=Seonamhaeicola sp. TaxID=1912245 RepID=UPI0026134BF7|nr:SusE domain-containing protein [Seonamhaeicola sp.]